MAKDACEGRVFVDLKWRVRICKIGQAKHNNVGTDARTRKNYQVVVVNACAALPVNVLHTEKKEEKLFLVSKTKLKKNHKKPKPWISQDRQVKKQKGSQCSCLEILQARKKKKNLIALFTLYLILLRIAKRSRFYSLLAAWFFAKLVSRKRNLTSRVCKCGLYSVTLLDDNCERRRIACIELNEIWYKLISEVMA